MTRKVLRNAGVAGTDVDGIWLGKLNGGFVPDAFCSSPVLQADDDVRWKPATRVENACASGAAALSYGTTVLSAAQPAGMDRDHAAPCRRNSATICSPKAHFFNVFDRRRVGLSGALEGGRMSGFDRQSSDAAMEALSRMAGDPHGNWWRDLLSLWAPGGHDGELRLAIRDGCLTSAPAASRWRAWPSARTASRRRAFTPNTPPAIPLVRRVIPANG
ncbi:hypothetical protein [Azospirillum oleiclasticum]|uniref:hypothetical protein n=1 Tax=Azospirillum oleiclasticum TaxID=2735135 RepID=UPI0015D51D3D|nr:hypothetical protein [Azospirillum oleiclasticum]